MSKKPGKERSHSERRRHLGLVASLGCVVCRNEGLGETPCNAHHNLPEFERRYGTEAELLAQTLNDLNIQPTEGTEP